MLTATPDFIIRDTAVELIDSKYRVPVFAGVILQAVGWGAGILVE